MPELSMPTRPSITPDWRVHARIIRAKVQEYLFFDSATFKSVIGLLGAWIGWTLYSWGKHRKGFQLLCKIHRAALMAWGNRRLEELIGDSHQQFQQGRSHPLHHVYADYVRGIQPTAQTDKFFKSPEKLFQGSAIVLKSPGSNERGVLALQYSYVYPLLIKLFDLDKFASRYYLVLEPSWSGFCDLNVLIYTKLQHPVFVGSIEPRDTEFIGRLRSNLVGAPFSSNTWVDDRIFRPLQDIRRDADIIMVAGWARYKRHHAFFRALGELRRRKVQPKVILAGYPIDLDKEDILAQADVYKVRDLLEVHEWSTPVEVNVLLNRAKVNVLWSRREGVNRAIIESMLAGTPCIVREGLNYGHRYPHINSQTGRFSSEKDLSHNLFELIENYARYSPRDWVLANMSCLKTAARLNETIKAKAKQFGENWTTDIVPKVNELNCVRYYHASDEQRFAKDYDFLRSCLLNQTTI
jgi:glycosyltransferase involved in cell wall biosynthesis